MSPSEFLIAFNGFRALIGDLAPSAEQWARICEFHTEAVGYEVKQKWAMEDMKRRQEQQYEDQKAQLAKQMQAYQQLIYQPTTAGTGGTVSVSLGHGIATTGGVIYTNTI